MVNPLTRVIIENVRPVVESRRLPTGWAVGDKVRVKAAIFAAGDDQLAGELLFRKEGGCQWQALPMAFLRNDEWYSVFEVFEAGIYEYTVQAWIDRFRTWLAGVGEKFAAGRDVEPEMIEGARIVAAAAELAVGEDRAWLASKACSLASDESGQERIRTARDPNLSRLMDAYAEKNTLSVYDKVLQVKVACLISQAQRVEGSLSSRQCRLDPGEHRFLTGRRTRFLNDDFPGKRQGFRAFFSHRYQGGYRL
jgi:starch synthase (maltosyl-transferring)